MTGLRCAIIHFGPRSEALAAVLEPLAAGVDLVPLSVSEDDALEARVERAAAVLAARLPASVGEGLATLARDELDVLIIDGEPERADLPGSWEGVARRFDGGLMADWLGLAYAHALGASRARDRAFDQLSLEAQIGDDALHRDILPYVPGDEAGLPPALGRWAPRPGWTPAYLASRYSSLACIRPGDNPELATVFTSRARFIDHELGDWLEQLRRPVYRCELLDAAGSPEPFAVVRRLAGGEHELSVAALNSSLVLEQRSHGARLRCPDDDARAAIEAFDRACVELDRYADAIHWRPGRRVIFNQREVFHGRRGGLNASFDGTWDRARWMLRWNATPADASCRSRSGERAAAPGREFDTLVAELARADAEHKPAWLEANSGPESDTAWLANFLRHSEW